VPNTVAERLGELLIVTEGHLLHGKGGISDERSSLDCMLSSMLLLSTQGTIRQRCRECAFVGTLSFLFNGTEDHLDVWQSMNLQQRLRRVTESDKSLDSRTRFVSALGIQNHSHMALTSGRKRQEWWRSCPDTLVKIELKRSSSGTLTFHPSSEVTKDAPAPRELSVHET